MVLRSNIKELDIDKNENYDWVIDTTEYKTEVTNMTAGINEGKGYGSYQPNSFSFIKPGTLLQLST